MMSDNVFTDEDLTRAGLLEGLHGDARVERIELIHWLVDQGFTLEQIHAEPAPMLLVAHRLLGDDGDWVCQREIAEEYVVDLTQLQKSERALGLARVDDPEAAVVLRADAEAAARLHYLVEAGLDAGQMVLFARRLAEGISHAVPAFRYATMSAALQPGYTELEVAQAYTHVVQRLIPLLGPMIRDVLFVQLRHILDGDDVNASEIASRTAQPGARPLTVAFADMEGFTHLGEVVSPEELVYLVERLTDLAHEVIHSPVRLVKTIGDAVMLVSSDPLKLLMATFDLLDAVSQEERLPRLRIGVASGWAVSRARDWFGSPVNVASRVTSVADPGRVLVEGNTYQAVGETPGLVWSWMGQRQLKGVQGLTQLYQVHRSVSISTGEQRPTTTGVDE